MMDYGILEPVFVADSYVYMPLEKMTCGTFVVQQLESCVHCIADSVGKLFLFLTLANHRVFQSIQTLKINQNSVELQPASPDM